MNVQEVVTPVSATHLASVASGESLASIARRLRKGMDASGPLRVAEEVMGIVGRWDAYESEVQLTADAWLKSVFGSGRGASFFQVRARAAKLLPEAKGEIHHEVAVYIVNATGNIREKAKECFRTIVQSQRARNQGQMSKAAAVKVLAKAGLVVPGKRQCAECARLMAEVERLRGG
jgi:hypothetical protein